MAKKPKSKRKPKPTIDVLPDFISTDKVSFLTGYSGRNVYLLAKKGLFPEANRGIYRCEETVMGLFRHMRELIAKNNPESKREESLLKKTRREKLEIEKGILAKAYFPREDVLRCVQIIGEEMKRLLYARMAELPLKLQGLDVVATGERLRAVVDETCLIIQQRTKPWTESTSETPPAAPSAEPTA